MKIFFTSFKTLIMLTLITGLIYPLLITGIAQVLFPHKANGSLIMENGQIVGSELIGQAFVQPKYFWSRLSATAEHPYNGGASSGSNYGPMHADLIKGASARIEELKKYPMESEKIPVDLVTASGSGLDPHISPAAAYIQVKRIAQARGAEEAKINSLVDASVESRQFWILGEPVVNVVKLNLALDRAFTVIP